MELDIAGMTDSIKYKLAHTRWMADTAGKKRNKSNRLGGLNFEAATILHTLIQ
jgi:hypothetical protein